jgi:aminoglycoside 3-N-acetyltransferase
MHAVEELIDPPYLFAEGTVKFSIIGSDGSREVRKYRCHGFDGYEQRYDRLESIMEYPFLVKGKILKADCYLIEADKMWESAYAHLKKDPFYFVDKV